MAIEMIKLKLKVKVPKAAYDAVKQWAEDNELEGTIEEALGRGAEQQFAQMYLAATAKPDSNIILPGDVNANQN